MKVINEVEHTYSICPICKDLMGPNTPVISMSYGFIESGGLYASCEDQETKERACTNEDDETNGGRHGTEPHKNSDGDTAFAMLGMTSVLYL